MSLYSTGSMKFKGYHIVLNRMTGEITFSKGGKVVHRMWRYTPYDREIKRVCDMLNGDIVPKSRRLEDVRRADGTIAKGETSRTMELLEEVRKLREEKDESLSS